MDTLTDLLKESSQRFGSATALVITPGIRQQRTSYAQLWEQAGNVASLLQERGLQKGDRAVIWASNCPEWVIAFLGCLRAGVIAVPLDVRSSPDFVERIIGQTEPKLAFCSHETANELERLGLGTIKLDQLEELVGASASTWVEPALAPEDLAELMFTSGTTGDPKGVMLTHRNIVSNVLASRQMVPIDSSNRLLSLLPLSHMLEQTGGLLVPLSRGATIIFPTSRQPKTLFNTMQKEQVTNLVIVPQALELLMSGMEREVRAKGKEKQWNFLMRIAPHLPRTVRRWLFREVHRQFGGKLRYLMSGGAYLHPDLAEKWDALGIPVLQGYGATEASPVITTNTLRDNRLGSVGRVLPGQELRIADDGEVLVKGPNVTQGYWQNPEVTKTVFDEGWYRTGDLGYLDDAGFLYLKGRKKDLIVLPNGQNVYPEDLESLLSQQPGVQDSVVLGLPSAAGGTRVHAVLLLEEGVTSASEAVSAVNRQVADHQRIRGHTIWPQEDFPRTHTMKIKKPMVLDFLQQGQSEPDDDPEEDPDPPPPSKPPKPPPNQLYSLVASLASQPLGLLKPGAKARDRPGSGLPGPR